MERGFDVWFGLDHRAGKVARAHGEFGCDCRAILKQRVEQTKPEADAHGRHRIGAAQVSQHLAN